MKFKKMLLIKFNPIASMVRIMTEDPFAVETEHPDGFTLIQPKRVRYRPKSIESVGPIEARRKQHHNYHQPSSAQRNYQRKTRPEKFKWRDPSTGNQLYAGGILFYNNEGIWVIREENDKGQMVYNDIGGKYNLEDGNIYACIARELGEETYHTCELTTSRVRELATTQQNVYVHSQGVPVYLCLIVSLAAVPELHPNPVDFNEARYQTVAENPDVDPSKFNVHELVHLKYEDIRKTKCPLTSRLKVILKTSKLFQLI